MIRSYLFAPGHNDKLLGKVFEAGADAVILDLEDAVPPEYKPAARAHVAAALPAHPAWVRINAVGTSLADDDLAAVAAHAHGIRIPKVESADDVRWVMERAPAKPLICAIETAKGVANALAIAAVPGVRHLALGGIDLQKDLGVDDGDAPLQYVRSHLVIASRAAGIAPPIDSVYPHLRDTDGLARQAAGARSLGFGGKSAIHPTQLPTIHAAFGPREDDLDWARRVVRAFERAGGAAVQLPDGEFVDLPVAERARRILQSR
ncbi:MULTISPECIES: CoA ester lyase [unclassified Rhodococcus (in: high G+C Gram-positive bacteria)]|uniref:HpcH/HpaI aldolase/citrate lyase family protein n=1 Tax=unclassified Rhodococcus (in: high G+C Gram-positive bacteria) TaxID=192944 RepID=UPI00163A5E21|nr:MULTISPECIES: CoA ester lyase [unclassified Rhodococcus (in: high G+C Gram-positive bacteria)]MBC2642018.1 CoA ester lyase [Rhodococcus sp. 3A]MBC2893240.1 CoA ester lyase [Rhodococcus sp. 4CII]